MDKKVLQREIETELSMRRKVWKRLYGEQEKFVSAEHQRRYDRLKAIGNIIGELTQGDINKLSIMANRQNEQDDSQQSLFQ